MIYYQLVFKIFFYVYKLFLSTRKFIKNYLFLFVISKLLLFTYNLRKRDYFCFNIYDIIKEKNIRNKPSFVYKFFAT